MDAAPLAITRLNPADVQQRVLTVGDPARAEKAAAMLEGATPLARNREYVSFNGTWNGVPLTVVSHGVGASGAIIAFEEVCRAGAQVIIRAGTAGGLSPDVVDGHLLVVTSAVREDGVTSAMVPPEFPAVSDPQLVLDLERHAQGSGCAVARGSVATMAAFYASPVLANRQVLWRDAGVLGVEMEVAALFVTASLHGVRAGAIVAIDGNPLAADDEDMNDYQPDREVVTKAVDAALLASLDTLAQAEA
ncbi:MAG: nucleoside phosphorylase [Beutenbergiaceae bacterium]